MVKSTQFYLHVHFSPSLSLHAPHTLVPFSWLAMLSLHVHLSGARQWSGSVNMLDQSPPLCDMHGESICDVFTQSRSLSPSLFLFDLKIPFTPSLSLCVCIMCVCACVELMCDVALSNLCCLDLQLQSDLWGHLAGWQRRWPGDNGGDNGPEYSTEIWSHWHHPYQGGGFGWPSSSAWCSWIVELHHWHGRELRFTCTRENTGE